MNELPETLDETYERILTNIPVSKRKTAHKVLQLLSFDTYGILSRFPYMLAEAVVVDVEKLSFKPEHRFLDQNSLFEICTCLITRTVEGHVILAHYSVKEYLMSNRIQHSRASAFQISNSANNILLAKTSLVYLLDITYDGLCSAKDYDSHKDQKKDYSIIKEKNFPLLTRAHLWPSNVLSLEWGSIKELDKVIIIGLVQRLLNPNGSHYKGWLESTQIYEINDDNRVYFPRWKTGLGLEPSIALAYACYFGLLGPAQMILDSNPDLATTEEQLELDLENSFNRSENDLPRTAVEIAIIQGNNHISKLLFDRGADPNGVNAGGDCRLLLALKVLGYAAFANYDEALVYNLLQVLFKAGADPNPRGVVLTPLQVACISHGYGIVEQLLKAGAHANAVGDDEAVVAAIQRDCSTEVGRFSQADIEEGIRTRGILPYYLTPIRMLVKHRHYPRFDFKDDGTRIRNLLIQYGGKSLNLFPIKDLPGYEEADSPTLYRSSVDQIRELPETSDSESEGTFEIEDYSDFDDEE